MLNKISELARKKIGAILLLTPLASIGVEDKAHAIPSRYATPTYKEEVKSLPSFNLTPQERFRAEFLGQKFENTMIFLKNPKVKIDRKKTPLLFSFDRHTGEVRIEKDKVKLEEALKLIPEEKKIEMLIFYHQNVQNVLAEKVGVKPIPVDKKFIEYLIIQKVKNLTEKKRDPIADLIRSAAYEKLGVKNPFDLTDAPLISREEAINALLLEVLKAGEIDGVKKVKAVKVIDATNEPVIDVDKKFIFNPQNPFVEVGAPIINPLPDEAELENVFLRKVNILPEGKEILVNVLVIKIPEKKLLEMGLPKEIAKGERLYIPINAESIVVTIKSNNEKSTFVFILDLRDEE